MVVSQHALQFVPQHALQQVSRVGMVSQHTLQVSRPTSRGEVEGLARGVSRPTSRGSPSPHLGVSRPTPREVCIPACTEADPPTATAADGMHPTGMHSCLFMLDIKELKYVSFIL